MMSMGRVCHPRQFWRMFRSNWPKLWLDGDTIFGSYKSHSWPFNLAACNNSGSQKWVHTDSCQMSVNRVLAKEILISNLYFSNAQMLHAQMLHSVYKWLTPSLVFVFCLNLGGYLSHIHSLTLKYLSLPVFSSLITPSKCDFFYYYHFFLTMSFPSTSTLFHFSLWSAKTCYSEVAPYQLQPHGFPIPCNLHLNQNRFFGFLEQFQLQYRTWLWHICLGRKFACHEVKSWRIRWKKVKKWKRQSRNFSGREEHHLQFGNCFRVLV